ncbi:MAG: B12-binding domain-containing radical SAM protein [bacterium]
MKLKSRRGVIDEIINDERWLIEPKREGAFSAVCLYPNSYWTATSNLGFHKLVETLNSIKGVLVERAFYDPKIERPGYSFLSKTQLKRFDIIAISLSYEIDYLNTLITLKKGGVPLLSKERGEDAPFVIFGGIAPTSNPEPITDFADIIFIGEIEDGFTNVIKNILHLHRIGNPRMKVLKEISMIKGVYIPSLYRSLFYRDKLSSIYPISGDSPDTIKKAYIKTLNDEPTKSVVLSNYTEFSNSFMIEINRGCPYNCQFCLSKYIYYPPRFLDIKIFESELNYAENILKDSLNKVSLIGSSLADHPSFYDILIILKSKKLYVGLSSFRAEGLKPNHFPLLKDLGVQTITIAPETGDDLEREKIGKALKNNEILEFARAINYFSIPNLKLYFMLGLSQNLSDEVSSIINLLNEITEIYKGHIIISVNPFVPKPHTPMSFNPLPPEKDMKKAFLELTKTVYRLKLCEIRTKSVRLGRIQWLLSLGDRRTGEYILNSLKIGHYKDISKREELYIPTIDGCKPWDHIAI